MSSRSADFTLAQVVLGYVVGLLGLEYMHDRWHESLQPSPPPSNWHRRAVS